MKRAALAALFFCVVSNFVPYPSGACIEWQRCFDERCRGVWAEPVAICPIGTVVQLGGRRMLIVIGGRFG